MKPLAKRSEIVGDDGEALPTGEVGTVYMRNLIGGDFEYHGAPEKTAAAHKEPGVMTVGDVGYLDEDGYLFLCDRKIDMIISGGVNIYPAEIMDYAREHLAGYKVPRSIDFTDEFPRTETGKLVKRELRDPYWKDRQRAI